MIIKIHSLDSVYDEVARTLSIPSSTVKDVINHTFYSLHQFFLSPQRPAFRIESLGTFFLRPTLFYSSLSLTTLIRSRKTRTSSHTPLTDLQEYKASRAAYKTLRKNNYPHTGKDHPPTLRALNPFITPSSHSTKSLPTYSKYVHQKRNYTKDIIRPD